VVDLPELTSTRLNEFMKGPADAPKLGGWLGAYRLNDQLGDLSQQIDENWWSDRKVAELERQYRDVEKQWHEAIAGLGPSLWQLIGRALDRALKVRNLQDGAAVLWLPTGALGLVPIGLAQDPASGRRLSETYEIAYAPSLSALKAAADQLKGASASLLAEVINPTEDLPSTEIEGALVRDYFKPEAIMRLDHQTAKPAAVLDALKGRSHWHFSTHGTFSWRDPRRSGLLMKDREVLTVGALFEAQGLGRPRLVVLSACETGLYDIDRNPDEFIGLPGTFMALGAAGVIGTLWPVDDRATALLIAKLYELHQGQGLAPAAALKRAQAWLREATRAELVAYVQSAAAKHPDQAVKFSTLQTSLATRAAGFDVLAERLARKTGVGAGKALGQAGAHAAKSPLDRAISKEKPFAHPYYWAGFIHTGL
jgi:CHAT domain-containing protein